MTEREVMTYDVVIVGAGPAGLSCAIHLKQLAPELSVCVLEKAATVGAQLLSGAVLEPRALDELLPDWRAMDAPIKTQAREDYFLYLTAKRAFRLPTPKPMHNAGNYIVSLDDVGIWMGQVAENLGVEIYPGFAVTDFLLNDQNQIYGVVTGDKGVDKQGQPTDRFQAGIALHAKQVVLAEGCRGSLTKKICAHYQLRLSPQTYGIGLKELWEVDTPLHQPGKVVHSIGWPLNHKTYGGSFLYHLDHHKVAVGFVLGLDYENTFLNPFQEMQRFKTHPAIAPLFAGGRRIGYGARAIHEGGLQSLPKLSFPGGVIVGDGAGFLNVPKIKGTHTAMKSGMLAAQAVVNAISKNAIEADGYEKLFKQSWLHQELHQVRNIRPAFKRGLWLGLGYSALDTYVLRGHAPWTFKNHNDYACLKPADQCQEINYPKPDNKLTFDLMSSVFLTNNSTSENQPCHLKLKNPALAISVNYKIYDSPESRYCPAGVYEIVGKEQNNPRLQINAANCIQCKTCDIKDPRQNINWEPPEGGDGPSYIGM